MTIRRRRPQERAPRPSPIIPGRTPGPIDLPSPAEPPAAELHKRYGLAVMATEFPAFVAFEEALETAVGSGAYGSFVEVGRIPSVPGDWTKWSGLAPNDGKRRRLRARHVKDGTTASAYTSSVDVLPWSSQPLPPLIAVQGTIEIQQDGTAVLKLTGTANVGSYKYSTSTSAYPTEASVQSAGTVINGRAPSDVVIAFMDYGTRQYVTVVPYSGENGAGVPGPAVFLTTTRVGGTDIPQGTLAISSTGAASFSFEGPTWAGSYRYSVSTSAFPVDATVAASGTILNGRVQASVASGVTLTLGQTIYITIVPFRDTGAGGFQGSAIHLSATRHDFSATKTVTFSASVLAPAHPDMAESGSWEAASPGGYFRNVNHGSGDSFQGGTIALTVWHTPIVVPDGVTITQIGMFAYSQGGLSGLTTYPRVTMQLVYPTGDGTNTNVQIVMSQPNATDPGVGWVTKTASLSEVTTGRQYGFQIAFGVGNTTDPTNDGYCRIARYSYTYTMPSSDKAI